MQLKKYAAMIIAFVLFVVTGLTYNLSIANATSDTPSQEQQVSLSEGADTQKEPAVQKVEYVLPYPGILPDHALYNLKRFRDYVLERLISDPMRKTEFYILQGDKRLAMGIALFDQKKTSLSESTISKGEKYMEKAVSNLTVQKANGGMIPPHVLTNIEKSLAKHAEVIEELMVKATDVERAGLNGSLALVQQLSQTVAGLK